MFYVCDKIHKMKQIKPLTFDQLPQMVNQLSEKIDSLQAIIQSQIPKTKNTEKDLMNLQEAADFLSLKKPTIYSKISRGEIPYMKDKHRVYFSRKELTDFLQRKRVSTSSETIENAHENIIQKP